MAIIVKRKERKERAMSMCMPCVKVKRWFQCDVRGEGEGEGGSICKEVLLDLPDCLRIYKDGSFTRYREQEELFRVPANPNANGLDQEVRSRDVVIHKGKGLWLRLFLPHPAPAQGKLPLVFYTHGGSYCMGDPDSPCFHHFACHMAGAGHAIWASLSYRLAPEHRLPAAYDDAMLALQWLQKQAVATTDPWLKQFTDFSHCLLAGESAGAAIALNVAMRLASGNGEGGFKKNALGETDWSPLGMKGLMLIHPGFHSEANRAKVAPYDRVNIALYTCAIPLGENFDYPPINPLNPNGPSLDRLSVFPNLLVAVAENDHRCDLTMDFCTAMEKVICGNMDVVVSKNVGHVFHLHNPNSAEAKDLERQLVDFMHKCFTNSDHHDHHG